MNRRDLAYVVWVAEQHNSLNPAVVGGGQQRAGLVGNLCPLAVAAPDDAGTGALIGRLHSESGHTRCTLVRATSEVTGLWMLDWM